MSAPSTSSIGRPRILTKMFRALFYRGLAEMRFLGFVKYTKKKADHLAKLAWKGL